MRQVVAGSDGNTVDLALRSTEINEEYINLSLRLKHNTKQSVEHWLQPMENPSTYATHTEIVAANQLIIVHPRATDFGWPALSITTKCKHMYVTYYQVYSNEH